MDDDVASPIDLRSIEDAREWAATAMEKRPWRVEFFAAFAGALLGSPNRPIRILELGSGPGFLAEYLLHCIPNASYVALDSSAAMQEMAATRLRAFAPRVRFIERTFRDPGWAEELGSFDVVVTMQAVHELRHRRHALELHRQVLAIMSSPSGTYLVCDHYLGADGMQNDKLFMTVEEQRAALEAAGFSTVSEMLRKGGMVLHQAVARS